MTRDEWFGLPWYEVQIFLEGLQDEGILGGKDDDRGEPEPTPQSASPDKRPIDLANADLSELGFVQTRRAG
jgi:hypothetical protein